VRRLAAAFRPSGSPLGHLFSSPGQAPGNKNMECGGLPPLFAPAACRWGIYLIRRGKPPATKIWSAAACRRFSPQPLAAGAFI